MQALKVTPSSAKADLTMSASRMSWKGRTFDSRRDLTFSEIQRRVVWDTVGLLAGTRLGSCNHQFLSQGGRHLPIPSCRVDLRKSECHSCQTSERGQSGLKRGSPAFGRGECQCGPGSWLAGGSQSSVRTPNVLLGWTN